jgi:iron complex outermembrane receptor protein
LEIKMKNKTSTYFRYSKSINGINANGEGGGLESVFHSKKILNRLLKVVPLSAAYAATLAGGFGVVPAMAGQIEEVTVTALKREESLQEVSVGVAVLDGDQLESHQINDVKDIQLYVPSLTVNDSFGTAQISSRGLGLSSVSAGIDPAIGLYVDGAVINSPAAQLFSLFDLERAEFLRGPQGSLFGRNTMAGAVNLITAKPGDELEGYARISMGNYSLSETEGALGGPLSEAVRARIAWRQIDRGGFGKNEFTGSDTDDLNQKMMRAHLEFLSHDDFNFLLTTEYARQDDQSLAFKVKGETFPDTPGRGAPGVGGFPVGTRNISTEFDPRNDRETWSITGTTTWYINEEVTNRNIFNYRKIDVILIQDLDLSSVVQREDVNGVGGTSQERPINVEQYSAEFQLFYDGQFLDRHIDIVSGIYLFSEESSTSNTIGFQPLIGRERTLPDGSMSTDKRVQLSGVKETESWAVFVNARYDITSDFTLKLAGRFNEDDISVEKENLIFVGGGLGPQRSISPFDDSETFNNFSPEVGVEWRPDDEMMLYYTYSEGFKAGTVPIGSTSGLGFVQPEIIDNHEFGLKSTWLDGSLIFNASAFYYEATDLQLQRSLPTGDGGFTLELANSADLDGYGFEADVFWSMSDSVRLFGSVAYVNTEFQDGFVSVDPTNPVQFNDSAAAQEDLGGNEAAQAPEWSATAHAEYDLPFQPGGGAFVLSTDISYKGDHYFSEFNNPELSQDAYTLVDMSLKFTAADEKWSATLWGKNLTDELVESGNFPLATGLVTAQTFLPPRTWGVSLKFIL